jgi:hypothetical protein
MIDLCANDQRFCRYDELARVSISISISRDYGAFGLPGDTARLLAGRIGERCN